LTPVEDLVHIARQVPEQLGKIDSISHQSTDLDMIAVLIAIAGQQKPITRLAVQLIALADEGRLSQRPPSL